MIAIMIIMFMIREIEGQHYETFASGIIVLSPLEYSQTNNSYRYRNFTIQSSASMIANSSLIFSPFSFNYFQNEISCL